jgi:hypothetical protein
MSGTYNVLASLGAGGFGTIYPAECVSDGAVVMMKVASGESAEALDLQALRRVVPQVAALGHHGVTSWVEVIDDMRRCEADQSRRDGGGPDGSRAGAV